ncbi:hypothetical protein L519_2179 [Bordetella bronchiseptica MBORD678]|uniref:DUF4128 domain-containing protein n=1 Tax=Bordetella bronchiseptica TaxID=518 RepID=UPI0004A17075|nr:DUF4128 domain-containing protein [Bordetella bronchiseptica]KDD89735.1 hypothetical protein L519_2179 [Bordetella bronchiseptica MBORD678]
MSQDLIRAAFEKRLNDWAKARAPALAVAWQNTKFTPPTNAMYLRAYVMPAATISRDAAGDHRQYRGLFQVNVVLPIGSGSRAAEQIGAELDALFPVNLTIASGGLAVRVRTPISSGQPTTGDADHTVPISLGYDVQFYPE